jgi:hypothetical protein
LIFGDDARTGERCQLYYGEQKLQQILRSGRGEGLRVLEVPLDSDSDELGALAVAVLQVKGSCCCLDEDENPLVDPGWN